jgi:hypothetical protein
MSHEIQTGELTKERREEIAWDSYVGSLNTYYLGVTNEEFVKDRQVMWENIEGLIDRFHGFHKAIDDQEQRYFGVLPDREVLTVREVIDRRRELDPELAEVYSKAVDLQQTFFNTEDAGSATYIERLLRYPLEHGSFVWSPEDAAAIKQKGYSTLDEYAATEVAEFSTHISPKIGSRALGIREEDSEASAKAKIQADDLVRQLGDQVIPTVVQPIQRIDVAAAIAYRNLEGKIRTAPNVARIVRETYVSQLIANMLFQTHDNPSIPSTMPTLQGEIPSHTYKPDKLKFEAVRAVVPR